MFCEPAEHGWSCLIRENNEWEGFGKFDRVNLKDMDVNLPVVSGVQFDGSGCEINYEDENKILECEVE